MNIKKLSLIVGVMIGLFAGVTPAAENFFAVNNQTIFDIPEDADTNQQLAQVRRATAKYHDINAALDDGFITRGGCVENAEGTEGIIYFSLARIQRQGVILEEPELLFYVPDGEGDLRLVAVGYFSPVRFIDTRGIIPGTFVSRLNPLPPYFQEVSGHFMLFNQPPDGPIIEPGLPWFYGIHAWVWSPNPNGMYAVRNPRLNCTANN